MSWNNIFILFLFFMSWKNIWKRSIFLAHAHRFLVLNSEPSGYYADMKLLEEQLLAKGYPHQLVSTAPVYDEVKRQACLGKAFSEFRDRSNLDCKKKTKNSKDKVVLILPFSPAFHNLRIQRRLKDLVDQLGLSTEAVLAYSVSDSLFLKTYPQNTPMQLCRSVRG